MRKTFKIGGVVLLAVLLLLAVFGLRGDDLIKETQEDASRGFYRENLAAEQTPATILLGCIKDKIKRYFEKGERQNVPSHA